MDIQIQTVILNTLQDLAMAVIPVVGAYAVAFIRKHMTTNQIETAKNVASISVKYAQQLDICNSDKFASALATAKSFASSHGLKLTDEQWRSLIEASVNECKKDWAEVSTITSNQTDSNVNNSSQTPVSDTNSTITTITTNGITIPEEMLQDTYNAILNKVEQDAKSALDKVKNDVQQVVVGQVQTTPVESAQTVEPTIPVQEQSAPSTQPQ